jgi:hypothetical protein
MRLLTLVFAVVLFPAVLGCGGSGESSYKDRQGTVDQENVQIEMPGEPGSESKP